MEEVTGLRGFKHTLACMLACLLACFLSFLPNFLHFLLLLLGFCLAWMVFFGGGLFVDLIGF